MTEESDACKEMRDKFQTAFEYLEETRRQNEKSINNMASSELQGAKRRLNASSPFYGQSKFCISVNNEKTFHFLVPQMMRKVM